MISVIIPVYKNTDLFLKNLYHNLNFLNDCQIIIVNDSPEKSLINDLSQFKQIVLIENKKNLGFGESVNQGVKFAKNRYIMILNSDVALNDKNYLKAINYFNKNNVFAVSFAQKEKNDSIVGKNKIYWQDGLFVHEKADNLKFGNNAWGEGGACVIDKDKFIKLGGFDPLYSPFYWEDIDLSYRAWKTGYKTIFEPRILVTHHHESTIGKYFTQKQIEIIAYRNQLIFTWKNLTDFRLIIQHLCYLPLWIAKSLIKRNWFFLIGLLRALIILPKILIGKIIVKKIFTVPDNKILSIFKNE